MTFQPLTCIARFATLVENLPEDVLLRRRRDSLLLVVVVFQLTSVPSTAHASRPIPRPLSTSTVPSWPAGSFSTVYLGAAFPQNPSRWIANSTGGGGASKTDTKTNTNTYTNTDKLTCSCFHYIKMINPLFCANFLQTHLHLYC